MLSWRVLVHLPPSPTPSRNSGPCAQKMRIQVKSYRDRHFHLVGKDDDDDYGDGDIALLDMPNLN